MRYHACVLVFVCARVCVCVFNRIYWPKGMLSLPFFIPLNRFNFPNERKSKTFTKDHAMCMDLGFNGVIFRYLKLIFWVIYLFFENNNTVDRIQGKNLW